MGTLAAFFIRRSLVSLNINGRLAKLRKNIMIFTIFNLLKGRFSKDAIEEAKSNEKAMTRQEALQQMRNIASRRSSKKN
ncbi:hypothetical protein LZD49_09715 [Dyadobacter sp. CY261]|nr:hypothetical protein [Dyadobacter sp. CY261]MCF0070749.1 hypothetical protein [Dyadobacter sp. CY261]